MKYKIEYRGCGVKFTPVYAMTIIGAVKAARRKGWRAQNPFELLNHLDTRPNQAWIFEQSGEAWERVAIVSERGIEADDSQARRSSKHAMAAKEEATRVIESNYATMSAINAICDKEFTCAATKTSVTQQHLTQQPSVQTVEQS